MFWGEKMKIIHTADWHLGKVLNGQSFLEDQAFILEQLIETLKSENPDVLVIAGDVFDTTLPNKGAVALMEKTISYLNIELEIPTIIIDGNHDGKERLGYGAKWFKHNQLYIRTQLSDFFTPIHFGNVDFYTLPFFTLAEARQYLEQGISSYEEAVEKLIERVKPQLDDSKQNILIGHFTVYGAPKSDSERDITVGTIESVSPHCLDAFDIVMLGHIHHPFALNQKHIYYSGSLLQYSFSEVNQPKGVRCFHLTDKKHEQTFLPLSPRRRLVFIETSFDNAIHGYFSYQNSEDYFHFNLSGLEMVKDPMQQLKQQFPNTLALTQQTSGSTRQVKATQNIKKMKPLEIIETFYQELTEDALNEVQTKHIQTFLNEYGEEE